MAKVTAPLFGFSASGAIADSIVYSNWRGVDYARQHVVPSNPRSTAQSLTRDLWRALSDMWKLSSPDATAPWEAFATGKPLTGRNAFMGQNLAALRAEITLADFIGSPGSGGGFAPATFGAVNDGALDQLVATFTMPATPVDWVPTSIVAVAFGEQATAAALIQPFESGTEDLPTLEITIAGLPHDQDNVVSGWIVWTRPDGKLAYGPSSTVIAAST